MPLDFSLFWEKELTESKQSLQQRTHISWKNYVLQIQIYHKKILDEDDIMMVEEYRKMYPSKSSKN